MIHKAQVTVISNEEIKGVESPFALGVFTFICMLDKLNFVDIYEHFGSKYKDEIDAAIFELIQLDLITVNK